MARPRKNSSGKGKGKSGGRTAPMGQKFSPTRLRIVSGSMRGRKVAYNGDPATRPMKERTREAVFSLLGGKFEGQWAVDLFAGTGILAFESVSRGASFAQVLEWSGPAVKTLLDNMKALDLESQIEVHQVDTLRWLKHADANTASWPAAPWLIFCCPPYRMWKHDTERLCAGLQFLWEHAPADSQMVCESETDFDLSAHLPGMDLDCRSYAPAMIGIARKPNATTGES